MEKPAQSREQMILEAAEHEFLTKGFAGARTTVIARAAGVTHAMLHYYFRTKEQLFERILDEKMHLMGESIISAFGQQGLPLQERLRNGVGCHFDLVAANPDLPRFIANEVFARPDRYEAMRHRVQKIVDFLVNDMQREMDQMAAKGEIEHMDVRLLILDVISLNVFPFIASPVIEPIFNSDKIDWAKFLEMRKAENIEIIMRRIKKI